MLAIPLLLCANLTAPVHQNKTSSAVQLTHLPTGLVVKSQATRSRSQNHTIARRILAEKIEFAEKGEDSRVAKKIERKVEKKKRASKKTRRKYRKLEEEKDSSVNEIEDGEEAQDGTPQARSNETLSDMRSTSKGITTV